MTRRQGSFLLLASLTCANFANMHQESVHPYFIKLKMALVKPSKEPLYQRLVNEIKGAIENFELAPSQMIPSTRELAETLDLSRSTVVRCYEDLLARGYIHTVDGVGTFVRAVEKPISKEETQKWPVSARTQKLLAHSRAGLFCHDFPELNFGCTPADLLPLKAWRQIQLKHARETDSQELDYGADPFGYLPLRSALADFLKRVRSVSCSAEQLIVFPSALYPLHLLAESLVNEKQVVIMADPELPYARQTFASAGAEIQFLPVDEEGLNLDHLPSEYSKDSIIYVSPSHHNPSGTVMSMRRREQLLQIAAERKMFIIEDDCNWENRQGPSPLPSLQGLSQSANVIYLSNFWSTLYPLINLGFMVIPKRLIPLFEQIWRVTYHSFQTHLPMLEQLTMHEFIADGHFERQIRKTEKVYLAWWRSLVQALKTELGKHVEIMKSSGGSALLMRLPEEWDHDRILKAAKNSNFALVSTVEFYHSDAPRNEFLVPFIQLEEDDLINRAKEFSKQVITTCASSDQR
ncbi:MAG: PLP-dependent aminotransferase family protein [Candidatus Obscuribacterales bacterium]|nr:PLP-dependent aminotransferase family protein [Candidatus Obscuribacterales bacterium]